MSRTPILVLSTFLLSAATARAEHVWIEGEAPTRANVKFSSAGWGHPEYLSGGKWLFAAFDAGAVAKKVPAEGALLAYDFEVKAAGGYEVWARVGYEFARAPFEWRLDGGAWAKVGPDELTIDLMALGDWAEVAWLQLGKAKLDAGKHTLELRVPRTFKVEGGKKVPERFLLGLDCFCLSKGPFRPNGPFRPGQDWRSAADRAAAEHVFRERAPKAGARSILSLAGTWQVARLDEREIADRTGPDKAVPRAGELFWKALTVPGNRDDVRPDLLYCHRFVCRARVRVPAEAKGGSFFLRFPSTALIASVIVNGRYCGFSKAPCAAWDCDVTDAVRPGEVNEVLVVIKDLYYCLEQDGRGRSARYLFNVPPGMFHNAGGLNLTRFADFPVLYNARRSGILEAPSLVATGPTYAADVFAKPSVSRKALALELTLKNPTKGALTVRVGNSVAPKAGGPAELRFAEKEVTIPAGGEKAVELSAKWASPKLWWPERPHLYEVATTLTAGGTVIDTRRTTFGFREWGWKGKSFTLNGVPYRLRADLTHNDSPPKGGPAEAIKEWRRIGMNTFRYWGERPWTGASQKETLDFFDAHGMAVRRSGIFDGQVASYLLVENKGGKTVARKALFDNWIHQLEAWVRAERNHPSVCIWSIENEITYINTRNFGWLPFVEPEIKRAADAVLRLDPTRPVMIDGGDALRDRSLPVYGNHYNEFPLREYPDEAYTLKLAKARYKMPGRDPWPIGDDKPLFLGESFFASGYTPSSFSQLSGESAFLGWPEARRGVGLFAKMLSEGYRWNGVAAFQFWLGPDRADLHHNSWQPVCVLCREWDWTFGSGQSVQRRLKVFNDTPDDAIINMRWELRLGGKKVANGHDSARLEAGATRDASLVLGLPAVKARTAGELVLTCERGGKEVFREVKPLWVIPTEVPRPALAARELVILDPKGPVKARLRARKIDFTEAKSFEELSAKAKVIVVGPDALTPRQATDPKWQALAAAGVRVLVLDQAHPLRYQATPADLEVTPHAGRVAFAEDLDHPAFAGLDQPDFFCRSGDHLVYRNAYRKPGRGGRSLVQCDEGLSCCALVECPLLDGLLILCQVPVGTKLATDPVAQRLFDNLLAHAASYRPVAKQTAVVFAAGDRRAKMLEVAGLKHRRMTDVVEAIKDKTNEVVVADASPANLRALADSPKELKAFNARGGWLMLWGLTPEGLASFNKVVGHDHVLRPFRLERVSLPAKRDPILSGLTMRDVVLESTRKIFPWSGDVYPADDSFTHIVDLEDIAPFCSCPKQPWGWSQMTNGLVSADAWVFIFSHNLKEGPKPRWTAHLPKEEEIIEFSIVPNTFYHHITKLRLHFDGKDAVTLDLKPKMVRQDFPIKLGRKVKAVTLEPFAWDAVGKQPVVSVENLWIKVKRSPTYHEKVVPLLNIGGLVKYRMGKGGIVLNQLRVVEAEANPVNAEKKRTIVATLLRNLGAAFASGKVLVAGANLKYEPVPLGERCNAYLTLDKGWIAGTHDLAHLPVGEQRLTGARYLIRDFRTSPVPSCVMLAGPGAKGDLPKAVRGLPVGRKADVLFFLHTFHQAREWRPRDSKEAASPPVVFRYVVHYADGKKAEVPVRLGREVGHWVKERPEGLPGAAVAWAAPFPKDAGRQAVVYQMPWNNPRPGVAVRSVDVLPGAAGWGVPVLLALTAATAE